MCMCYSLVDVQQQHVAHEVASTRDTSEKKTSELQLEAGNVVDTVIGESQSLVDVAEIIRDTDSNDVQDMLATTTAGSHQTSSDLEEVTINDSDDIQNILAGIKIEDSQTSSFVADITNVKKGDIQADTSVENLTTESMEQIERSETVITEMHRGKLLVGVYTAHLYRLRMFALRLWCPFCVISLKTLSKISL